MAHPVYNSKLETGRAGEVLLGKLLNISFPSQGWLVYKVGSYPVSLPDSSPYIQDLMMPSFVYQVLSLTTIIILSLAQPDGFDLTTRNVAQSLIDPVASLDGLNVAALGFGTSSNADVSSSNLDANSVGSAQVVVARPDAHSCSKGKRRRRRDETSCQSTDIAVPSSQQNKPQNSDEQPSDEKTGQENQQDTPDGVPSFAPVLEVSCPEKHFPICAAPNMLENPSAPGTYTYIPWVGHNIPQTIDVQEYSRFCASI